jgi:hypothetical protein
MHEMRAECNPMEPIEIEPVLSRIARTPTRVDPIV